MMPIGVNAPRLIGTGMEIATQFFHASATARKKVNHIISLDNDAGN